MRNLCLLLIVFVASVCITACACNDGDDSPETDSSVDDDLSDDTDSDDDSVDDTVTDDDSDDDDTFPDDDSVPDDDAVDDDTDACPSGFSPLIPEPNVGDPSQQQWCLDQGDLPPEEGYQWARYVLLDGPDDGGFLSDIAELETDLYVTAKKWFTSGAPDEWLFFIIRGACYRQVELVTGIESTGSPELASSPGGDAVYWAAEGTISGFGSGLFVCEWKDDWFGNCEIVTDDAYELGDLQVTPDGHPAVVYFNFSTSGKTYAEKQGDGSWLFIPVDSDEMSLFPFFGFDAEGAAYALWKPGVLSPISILSWSPDMSPTLQNTVPPHYDPVNGGLNYAQNVAVSSDGALTYALYQNAGVTMSRTLFITVEADGHWTEDTVSPIGWSSTGFLVVGADPDGDPYLSFRAADGPMPSAQCFARREGTALRTEPMYYDDHYGSAYARDAIWTITNELVLSFVEQSNSLGRERLSIAVRSSGE